MIFHLLDELIFSLQINFIEITKKGKSLILLEFENITNFKKIINEV